VTRYPRIAGAERLYAGWGTVTRYQLEMRAGEAALPREVYDHGNAAAILLCDPARNTVLLVRQFRVPALLGGDGGPLLEVAAGLLDGLDPATCAAKEAEEETGHRPRHVRHAFDAYLSPGSLSEKLHLFTGEYDESTRVSAGGGLADEGEEIEVVELAFPEAFGLIASGGIIDAKTTMLLQHAALGGLLRLG
jgi:nudix-type nucleoside diphosphatase (YffH/AdpP family)